MAVSARFVIFFFQAEDGIRDADVTGVQTCALPIYRHGHHQAHVGHHVHREHDLAVDAGTTAGDPGEDRPAEHPQHEPRSEERRVGKECRSRWAAYHLKKNVQGYATIIAVPTEPYT